MAAAITFLQAASSTADSNTYTFSSQNIGTAAADRYILVVVSTRDSGTAGATLSSLTIGGQSAAIYVQRSRNPVNTNAVAIAAALVTSGATADIAVIWDTPVLRCAIEVYHVTGADMSAAHGTAFDDTSGDVLTMSLDVPAGGFAVGGGIVAGSTTGAWSGITEDHEGVVEATTFSSASGEFASAQTGLSITWDPVIVAVNERVAVAASFAEDGGGPPPATPRPVVSFLVL